MHPRPPGGLPSCLLNPRPGSLPGLSGGSSPGYSGDSSLRPPVDSPHGSSVGSLPGRLVDAPAGNPEGCRPISPGGSLPDSPAGRGAGRCPDHRPDSLPMYLGDGVSDATAAAAGRTSHMMHRWSFFDVRLRGRGRTVRAASSPGNDELPHGLGLHLCFSREVYARRQRPA